jgi:VWFA-related protein
VRAALIVAVALVSAAHAQTPPSAPATRIDAVAFDRSGRAVETLGPGDFEIIENGAPREIASVDFVKADGALEPGELAQSIESHADEQFQAAREGTRLFAIFLDEYHVTPGDGAAAARRLLTDFIERSLGPRDLVLVAKPLDSLLTLRMTRDRDAVFRAIAGFEGRKGLYEPRSALETSIFAGDRSRIESARGQVVASALNAITVHLARLSVTRKALVFVSEGFDAPVRRRADAALPTLDTVIRSANRGTVSLYPIDPRALVPSTPEASAPAETGPDTAAIAAAPDHRDLLARLAAETDGFAITTPASVTRGIDRIVRDTSTYYLLTLAGVAGQAPDTFHPVDVKVRTAGVTVRARKGYWPPSPDDLARVAALSRERTPPAPPLLPRRASPLIRPWFGMVRGPSGDPHVSFVWEPAARVPGERGRMTPPARIVLKALGPDGRTLFEGAVRPAGGAPGPSDMPSQLVFAAPPGRVRIEMAIEDATARLVDTDVRDIVVRPLTGPVAIATPEILRSRTAREHRALETSPQAVPVASRQFSRLERLWIRVAAYAEAGEPQVSARLLSAIGGEMRVLDVRQPWPGICQVDVPLAGLAAGEYSVELSAASGGSSARESVTFRVTP